MPFFIDCLKTACQLTDWLFTTCLFTPLLLNRHAFLPTCLFTPLPNSRTTLQSMKEKRHSIAKSVTMDVQKKNSCRNMLLWYQRSTEGRRSTAEAEGFLPSATATAAEGPRGRRPKFWGIPYNNHRNIQFNNCFNGKFWKFRSLFYLWLRTKKFAFGKPLFGVP